MHSKKDAGGPWYSFCSGATATAVGVALDQTDYSEGQASQTRAGIPDIRALSRSRAATSV